jgi:uncharacterized membrane protein
MSSERSLTKIGIIGLYFVFSGLFFIVMGAYNIYTPFFLEMGDLTLNSILGGVARFNLAEIAPGIGVLLMSLGILNVIVGQGIFRLKRWAWRISTILLILTSFFILPVIFIFWMFDPSVREMFFRKPGIQGVRAQISSIRQTATFRPSQKR